MTTYRLPPPIEKGNMLRRVRRAAKFYWHCAQHRQALDSLCDWLVTHPLEGNYFRQDSRPAYYTIRDGYLHRACPTAQGLQYFFKDLDFIREFCNDHSLSHPFEQPLLLYTFDSGFTLTLALNPINGNEGILALVLNDEEGRLCYLLSFCLSLAEDTFTVVTVQGRKSQTELTKALTKQCYGLRTPMLMLECGLILAALFNKPRILAVRDSVQMAVVKRGKQKKSGKVIVKDYDQMYEEFSAGELKIIDEQYCQLLSRRKSAEEVPTRKRALYRKRYALLDEIKASFRQHLNLSP
ncbi:DUF535 family protein [Suttonella ornithocola]|uniref:Protein of uncharacterized function (DUF535) n=1 Tax=Suttonella ornithocola TaxID=279832 RepID=A0A380MM97_9GAMM|nr:DUF535 family protein [Suttonella ornithocola]SUO93749.1 Protein of uncharacterised function (DUF535) [Suttonella ornithocola]